jgi:2-(1,2-epoxy-1,2-dihydrophenyl)acetyl-CoA isomerase
MLGDKLPAEQAAQWGLIWKCVADDALATEVDTLARHFAQAPTRGLAATKQAIQASASNTLAQQLMLERDLMREMGQTADYREGVSAFIEKRAPRFQGV